MALPRYGTVEEIAGMVADLASPEAGFITGANLMIDGGFSAQKQGATAESCIGALRPKNEDLRSAQHSVRSA